jgi:hypothetical protein
MNDDRFLISALVDFPDDCHRTVFTAELVGELIDKLRWMGVRRVYWNYYHRGAWDRFADRSPATRQTIENLGEPVAVGCRLAHERGMEFYATIKPYETGGSHASPIGSPDAAGNPGLPGIGGMYTRVQPFVMSNPHMRVRIRSAELPVGLDNVPIERIQLRQMDMTPVRIKPANLQIWTSDDNNGYRKKDVTFAVTEGVDACRRDVVEINGGPVTKMGDTVRTIDITGLSLENRFIAVTTNLDGDEGTFRNTALEMVRAYGPGDRPLPIVVASHKAVWRPDRDLRTGDLEFDAGVGDVVIRLDVANSRPVSPGWSGSGGDTSDGVVAFARGRNEFVSGALCEGYPEVREHWLSWVGECIAAGVDGVDVRISNHSGWSNDSTQYGFNEPVVQEYRRRHGVDPNSEPYEPELLGAVRGDFFDRFLRSAKLRLSAAGKRLQVHCEVESFRPEACQARWRTRPGNITFNWRRWLRSGLADEATLFGRAWGPEQVLGDSLGQEMIGEASASGVPMHLSQHVSADGPRQADMMEQAFRSGGLSGYTYYETAGMFDSATSGPEAGLSFHTGLTESIRERVTSLGLGAGA